MVVKPSTLDLAVTPLGSGAPVVVLHRPLGRARNWLSTARALQRAHTLHLVDLRNHGASPWSDDTSYAAMARDVAALIERLGPVPVRVVGHGMRGFLLQNLDTVDGRFTWQPNLAVLLAVMPALTGSPAELAGQVVRGPAWCLRGGESSYVEAEAEAALRRHFPRLGLRSVPGAGDWPHAERPVRSSACSSPRSPPDAFGRASSAEQ